MAVIPVLTKIQTEDIPAEHRQWFGKVAQTLNSFISSTVAALTSDLSFEENMRTQYQTLSFTYSANTLPMKFVTSLAYQPKLVIKAQIRDVSSTPKVFTAAVDVLWQYNGSKEIQINQITGLVTGQTYSLIVLVAS